MRELAAWLERPDPDDFPYDAVVAEYHRVGKHFVPGDLLAALDRARAALADRSAPAGRRLAGFLATALDKFDGRYDNPSYLAIDLLPLPGTGEQGDDPRHAARQRDRLLAALVADTLRFELAAADGATAFLPEMRPSARTTAKRCRHGLRAIEPALRRLGLDTGAAATDPVAAARHACRAVLDDLSPVERRTLQLTLLPVYVAHDEYMFMRMLQCYETTFALMGVHLRAAIAALADGRAAVAIDAVAAAERALREAAPLFSFVATITPEAFLTFREFTDGASAIQSRGYKTVESLCRTPEPARLDSPAYRSVPEVRDRVLAGRPTIDAALETARAAGLLTSADDAAVCAAMARFEAGLLKWRQTHYRLAVRMLGERRGTGYTEGVPYLGKARTIPVFSTAGPAGTLPEAA